MRIQTGVRAWATYSSTTLLMPDALSLLIVCLAFYTKCKYCTLNFSYFTSISFLSLVFFFLLPLVYFPVHLRRDSWVSECIESFCIQLSNKYVYCSHTRRSSPIPFCSIPSCKYTNNWDDEGWFFLNSTAKTCVQTRCWMRSHRERASNAVNPFDNRHSFDATDHCAFTIQFSLSPFFWRTNFRDIRDFRLVRNVYILLAEWSTSVSLDFYTIIFTFNSQHTFAIEMHKKVIGINFGKERMSIEIITSNAHISSRQSEILLTICRFYISVMRMRELCLASHTHARERER